MPHILASLVTVIVATVYMFQTFGGTSSKLDSVAQKAVILTEIENIKKGLQFYMSFEQMTSTTTLKDLADLTCFAPSINEQLKKDYTTFQTKLDNLTIPTGVASTDYDYIKGDRGNAFENTYSAISLGARENPSLLISLLTNKSGTNPQRFIPGIRVQLLGKLEKEKAWLERQIIQELKSIAYIDTRATWGDYMLGKDCTDNGGFCFSSPNQTSFSSLAPDGIFTLYFKDLVGVLAR